MRRLNRPRPAFAMELVTWRQAQEITQRQLAGKLRVSTSLVARYETGGTLPTADLVRALLKLGFEGTGLDPIRTRVSTALRRAMRAFDEDVFPVSAPERRGSPTAAPEDLDDVPPGRW